MNDDVSKDLKEVFDLAKAYNVRSLELDGSRINVTFFPTAAPYGVSELGKPEPMPTEDEFLFMSSGHPMTEDEMKAKPPA